MTHVKAIAPSAAPPQKLFLDSKQRDFFFAGLRLVGLPE
jgi:hypothetical protein